MECSSNVLSVQPAETLIHEVHDVAASTGLFREGDIKARIRPFSVYTVGGGNDDFLHVFAYIMQGRTTEQKRDLSERIVKRLKELLPDVPILSINVMEFEKATYCNRTMV